MRSVAFALCLSACVPQSSSPTSGTTPSAAAQPDDGSEPAVAVCQHLQSCGLADDFDGCVAEMASYGAERTQSLTQRSCDELAAMKRGEMPESSDGGGGGNCAVNGTNDCGMGQMCCASAGGAASPGVPGMCQSVATCTGPRR